LSSSHEPEPTERKFIVSGRDGELREITETEMVERDTALRSRYDGTPLEIGRIVRQAGTPNPPFLGKEEMFLDNK